MHSIKIILWAFCASILAWLLQPLFFAPTTLLAQSLITATAPISQPTSLAELKSAWWNIDLLRPMILSRTQPTSRTDETPKEVAWWQVVYQKFQDNHWHIFRVAGDNSETVQLTSGNNDEMRPRLKRDLSQIVYVVANKDVSHIAVMNNDGTNQRQLTQGKVNDNMPAWSPDGNQIVFVSNRHKNFEIYVMNSDGSNVRRLTSDPSPDLYPTWSPDGSKIAWVRVAGSEGVLWVVNADGSNPYARTAPIRYLARPAWAPNSIGIAFDYDSNGDGLSELGQIFGDGIPHIIGHRNLTPDTPLREFWMDGWSPDGKNFLYSVIQYKVNGDKYYIANAWTNLLCFNSPFCMIGYGNDQTLLADIGSLDLLPPIASIDPLIGPVNIQTIKPTWTGVDNGPSGIGDYEVSYRTNPNAPWQLAGLVCCLGGWTYALEDRMIYFRVHAIDNAGNIGPWSGDTEAAAEFYVGEFSQPLTDNRGYPMTHIPITVTPALREPVVTNHEGNFTALLPGSTSYSLSVNFPGYAPVAGPIHYPIYSSVTNLYLHPTLNLIQDGDFEATDSPSSQWHIEQPERSALMTDWYLTSQVGHIFVLCSDQPCGIKDYDYPGYHQGDGLNTLSQIITLPKQIHQPTLTFDYMAFLRDDQGHFTRFAISVTDSLSVTRIFTPTGYMFLNQPVLGWADLSPWAGQTITLTFSIFDANSGSISPSVVLLDNIAVSSWSTPFLETVTPNRLEISPTLTNTITIRGSNFVFTPTVQLGNIVVPHVRRVDEQTLEATLAPDQPPGLYDLWVFNPDGPAAVLPQAIQIIGRPLYLPLIER